MKGGILVDMLFQISDVKMEGAPFVNEITVDIRPREKRLRFMLTYVNDVEPLPVDLSLEYQVGKLSIDLRGIEGYSELEFRLKIGVSVLGGLRFPIKGRIGDKGINTNINDPIQLLNLIKSAL